MKTSSHPGAPMTPEQLISFPIFEGISATDASKIVREMTRMSFDSGATILHEGKSIQALWIIVSGECVVARTANDRREMILAELKAGDVFGEMSFVRNAPHSATIRATSPVTVCTFTREDFMKISETAPGAAFRVSLNIAAVLAERLRRMDTWVGDLVNRPEASEHRDEWQTFRSAVYSSWNL
ncbi:MAG: cyclic nucleotide-binding domain-containing protein [Planctomyces sp.]|jgi:CRP-like cAMP-binding protein